MEYDVRNNACAIQTEKREKYGNSRHAVTKVSEDYKKGRGDGGEGTKHKVDG